MQSSETCEHSECERQRWDGEQDRHWFCSSPVNQRDSRQLAALQRFAELYSQKRPVLLELPISQIVPTTYADLQVLESLHQVQQIALPSLSVCLRVKVARRWGKSSMPPTPRTCAPHSLCLSLPFFTSIQDPDSNPFKVGLIPHMAP